MPLVLRREKGSRLTHAEMDGNWEFVVQAARPEQFDAVGDGVADDTTAVSQAIADTQAGGKLFLEEGKTYLVTGDVLTRSTSITFIGTGTLKLAPSVSSKAILHFSGSSTRVVIDGPTFDLNQPTSDGWTNIGIRANSVKSIVLKGATRITNSAASAYPASNNGYGLYLLGAFDRALVESGVKFELIRYGVITEPSSTGRRLRVVGADFEDMAGDGVEINVPSGSLEDGLVSGCNFRQIGSNSAASGFGVGASGGTGYIQRLRIVDNDFFRCDHQGVHIEDGCRVVIMTGNTILDTGYGGSQPLTAGIYIAASVSARRISKVIVSGNIIVGVASMNYGVYAGGSVPITALVTSENIIEEALLHGFLKGSVIDGFSTSGNIIFNCSGPAIRQAASRGVVGGNVCFDNQTPKTQTYGIEINTGTDVNYIGNVLKDNLTGALLVTSPGTRNRFISNVEAANAAITIETENKTMLDATETENGMAVPVKLNAQEDISISGTVNNQAVGVNQVLNVTSATTTPQLTGLVARAGTQIIIMNNSGASFDIMHQHASSTDINRFVLKAGADLTLGSGQARQFYYSAGLRWQEL